ncbi:MAG TPA: hypothetical protein ENN20_05775 [Candidatus Marinimicrobia bacterium]|nr:hypothetical protein [Candidatus Neomarinimicrobiota bacterium]
MSKQWKELTFTQLQPLHIGMGNYGVMSPTRLFITGYTMWGALTAGLGRLLDKTEEQLEIDPFTEISNFYPVIGDCAILFPYFKEGELYYGKYSEKQFRYEFTDTIMSTSILPENQSAKDQGLHEIEILLPASKKNSARLSWKGILKIEKEKQADDYLKEGMTIIVGGEAGYGFGMLKLQTSELVNNRPKWNLSNNGSGFDIDKNVPIVHFSEGFNVLKGIQSPWYEIQKDKDFKANLKMVWHPGSITAESVKNSVTLKKGLLSKS